MKKILFAIDSITCGGAERALVALLNHLDYSKYTVDLLYFCQDNEYYKSEIPAPVHIIQPDASIQFSLSSGSYVLRHITCIRYLPIILGRLWFAVLGRLDKKNYYRRRAKDWKYLGKFVSKIPGEYDAAIAFIETNSVYFTLDKVSAKKYIAWQHTDYKIMGCCPDWDMPYFQRSDHICVLSEEMKKNFLQIFPDLEKKVIVFPNINDNQEILSRSLETVDFDPSYNGLRIISCGTLRGVKGYDVSMRACKRLLDAGYFFKWYVLGSGEEYEQMQESIKKMGLSNHFILLGNKRNPYAYMRKSDVFVQCSYREGFSTTVYEAKCLQKPIVITDAPGMRNQIDHEKNGLICPIGDDQAVASALMRLLDSAELREKFSKELEKHLTATDMQTQEKIELFNTLV